MGEPSRKRGAGAQLTPETDLDGDESAELTGPMPKADAATMATRRVLKVKKTVQTGAPTPGLFANISTAGPGSSSAPFAGFGNFGGFGASSSSAGAAPAAAAAGPGAAGGSSPFGSLGSSGSPFSVKPGTFPPIAAGESGSATKTFPTPDTSKPNFAKLPSPFSFGGSSSPAASGSGFGFGFGGSSSGAAPAASGAGSAPGFTFGAAGPFGGFNALSAAAKENEGKEFKKEESAGGDDDPEGFQPEAVPPPKCDAAKALEAAKPASPAKAGPAKGEEEDEVHYQGQFALLEMKRKPDGTPDKWEGKCEGTLRISSATQPGSKARLILRREAQKLVLNEALSAMDFSKAEPQAGQPRVVGPVIIVDEQGKNQTYLFRARKGHDADAAALWAALKKHV